MHVVARCFGRISVAFVGCCPFTERPFESPGAAKVTTHQKLQCVGTRGGFVVGSNGDIYPESSFSTWSYAPCSRL